MRMLTLLKQARGIGFTNLRLYSNSTHGNKFDLKEFTTERIRNFCIIAHVDHGKSTLSDRLLEMTGLIDRHSNHLQFLDNLQVEKERGITVKAQSVSLIHEYEGTKYLLNLIDTPGHVDFSFEVTRSLVVCNGALLVIDAKNGIQAQTIAHFNQALLSEQTVIPILNKIDLKNADPEKVIAQLKKLFSMERNEVLKISAKLGTGIDEVLKAIITRVPCPKANVNMKFNCMVFDSWFDRYKGVICLIYVRDGSINVKDKIVSLLTNKIYEVKEVGILHPAEFQTDHLYAGQVGFFSANIRDPKSVIIGDIFVEDSQKEGDVFHPKEMMKMPIPKPMVFAGIFPCDELQTSDLKAALEKLVLTDSSVVLREDSNAALGHGWQLGFLGFLHMEVFCQRLEQEFDAPTVITAPTVSYKVKIKGEKNIKFYGSDEIIVSNPLKMPDQSIITESFEPWVHGTIVTPDQYLSAVNKLCMEHRGVIQDQEYIDQDSLIIQIKIPLSEVIIDFVDSLKGISSGYSSFDYEHCGYERVELVKIDVLLNGSAVQEMSRLSPRQTAKTIAKDVCSKLKENLNRQQFKIIIQAVIGSKVIGREDVKPYRKDVTAKLYGGDITRRNKLLFRQKEGKSRMRSIGTISIDRDIFIKILKKSS